MYRCFVLVYFCSCCPVTARTRYYMMTTVVRGTRTRTLRVSKCHTYDTYDGEHRTRCVRQWRVMCITRSARFNGFNCSTTVCASRFPAAFPAYIADLNNNISVLPAGRVRGLRFRRSEHPILRSKRLVTYHVCIAR